MLFNQFFNIFNKGKKNNHGSSRPRPETTTDVSFTSTTVEDINTSSTVSEVPPLPTTTTLSSPPQLFLPQVEFEESRNLLKLDFFQSDFATESYTLAPNFEYLLTQKELKNQREEEEVKPKRRLTTTLRHKMSMYRPSKNGLKRSLSSPHLI